jgi:hypothetical protein
VHVHVGDHKVGALDSEGMTAEEAGDLAGSDEETPVTLRVPRV